MILIQVRDYLRERGQVPLREMADYFELDEDTLRGILGHWVRKGKVRLLPPGTSCTGCHRCDPEKTEIYAWHRNDN